MRLLVVDDDAGLLALIRATLEDVHAHVVEAGTAAEARRAMRSQLPDVIILDVLLPQESGLDFCRELKANPATARIPVILLSGELAPRDASTAGADAYLPKPFSPLQLLALVERFTGGYATFPLDEVPAETNTSQLMLYARDLRRVVELERAQRRLLEESYGATVSALADALAIKDTGARDHSRRVQRYAAELLRVVGPELVDDVNVEYGFLLHDVGKIGIADKILQKPGPLSPEERRVIEQHPVLGYDMLRDVAFLSGEALAVVRSHHERWDGGGYPDGLAGPEIPLVARVFSVADALDAMTSNRPYRRAKPWRDAAAEIARESGAQFDPHVVLAFQECESELYELRTALAA